MFDPTTLLGIHTWLSLFGMVAGTVVVIGLLRAQTCPAWTLVFFAAAVATDVTGYLLPAPGILPSHIVGALSLVALVVGVASRYRFGLMRAWRRVYAVTAVIVLYLLVFVGIAQAFLKVPALHTLAPTGSEPAFAITQLVVLVLFALLAIAAARAFRPAPHS